MCLQCAYACNYNVGTRGVKNSFTYVYQSTNKAWCGVVVLVWWLAFALVALQQMGVVSSRVCVSAGVVLSGCASGAGLVSVLSAGVRLFGGA